MDSTKRLQLYQEFIRQCTTSSGSWQNYSQFGRIDKIIKSLHPEYNNLIEYESSSFVKELQNELLNLDELPTEPGMTFKKLGNGQYNNAISTYIKFLKAVELIVNTPSVSRSQNRNLNESLQQIYYGAPGTGKSHSINEQTEGESVIRTTFHPDSDYSTFVGAYKPTTKQITLRDMSGHPIKEDGVVLKEDRIVYEFVDQAFLQAYVKAWEFYAENEADPKKQFLVIEEINRGNCAQIFGDLFQLLDRNEWGFSDYPINADKDMKKQLKKAFTGLEIKDKQSINGHYKGRDVVKEVLEGDILLLPSNLYIWATMNTSDQSLFPIDSAFKRRWDWQYMPIAQGRDEAGKELAWTIDVNGSKYSWWSFLEKINAQIGEATQSEDKKLGFFFCKAKDGVITPETFVGKVVFYLWNDVFKDYGFEGSIFKDKDGTELSFNKFYAADLKGNAVVQKDKVELFLTNLGVEIVEEDYDEEYEDGEEYEDEGARVSDTNAPYRVTFPDGEIICEGSGWETYVATLQKIGLEKALPFGEMYSRLNKTLPLITKKKIADQGVYKYYEVDGYYVLSGTDSQHRLLKRMNKDLNLGLTIE